MGFEAKISETSVASCNLCGSDKSRPVFVKAGYELVECEKCGLAYIANPPDSEELARIYSAGDDYHVQLFNENSEEFMRMASVADQHMKIVRRFVKSDAKNTKRLLDIGCSSGLFLDKARSAGFDVKGIEFSKESAAFAREHFDLDVHCGTLESASLTPKSFDVVTSFDVIEHVPDPMTELVAMAELLTDGGTAILSTPNIDGLFPKASYPLSKKLDYWTHPEPPYHLYQFSVRTLTAMLEKAGFEAGRVVQLRMPLKYSFGGPAEWKISPKMMAYAAMFAPSALVGPWIGKGDWFYIEAHKKRA